MKGTWKMSSSSSTTTIPAPLRITSTVLGVQPAAPTRALPTPSSPQETCGRLGTLSGCWRRPGRPSTLNCFSSWTQGVVEEVAVAECVTVAAAPTTLTSCTRRSVIAACALVAAVGAKTAEVASAATAVTTATAVTETAPALLPLPPTGTEVVITGIATTRAQISTRVTAAVGDTTPAAEASRVEVEVRISPASCRVSLASLLLLLHQQGGRSLSWLSSLHHHSHRSWASWGSHLTLLLLHPLLLRALHLPGSRTMRKKHQVDLCSVVFSQCNFIFYSPRGGSLKGHISKEVRAYVFYLFHTF